MILGATLGLLAAVGFGTSAVFARLGLRFMRSGTGTLVSLVVGVILTTSIAVSLHWKEMLALPAVAFLWLALSGLINFPLGRLLNFTGVSMVGVSRSAPIVGSSPLWATALAVGIGGESLNLPIALGTAAIIGGLALILSQ